MENSKEDPQKLKNRTTIESRNPKKLNLYVEDIAAVPYFL
jgi:hypothetical protein